MLNDIVYINSNTNLDISDYKNLSLLYLPIIGNISFSIYMSLYNLSDNQNNIKYTISDIVSMFDISEKIFFKNLSNLEALSLVKVYKNENMDYIFLFQKPYNSTQFYKEFLLDHMLRQVISNNMYENIFKSYDIFDISKYINYKDITKKYSDVFKDSHKDYIFIPDSENRDILVDSKIDLNTFIEEIPQRYRKNKIFDQSFLVFLKKIAFTYSLNEKELAEMFIISSDNSNKFPDQKDLVSNAINIYKQKTAIKDIDDKSSYSDKEKYLNDTPIPKILAKYCKQIQPYDNENATNFYLESNIDRGVINCLLVHILENKEGVLPNKLYLKKVLDSWINKGITTTKKAIQYTTEYDLNKDKYKNNYKKKTIADKEDWFDELYKEL